MDAITDYFVRYPGAAQVIAWFLVAGIPLIWVSSVFVSRDVAKGVNFLGPITGMLFGSAILYRLHSWPF